MKIMVETTNNKQENSTNVWKGVTIEELKFMRAVAAVKLELQKDLLKNKASETLPAGMSSAQGVSSKINGKLSFIQKALLFVKGVRMATSVVSFFKSSKKR